MYTTFSLKACVTDLMKVISLNDHCSWVKFSYRYTNLLRMRLAELTEAIDLAGTGNIDHYGKKGESLGVLKALNMVFG